MSQQVRKRFQKTIQFQTNNKWPEELSRGMVYRELYLRLKGQVTIAKASNTAANVKKGDEWGVVKKIEIIANNTDVIRSFSGTTLWWLNRLMYGSNPFVTAGLLDTGTDNPSFDSVLILPFWMPNSLRPIDTALDSRNLSSLRIEITWGTFTDINSAASAWTTNPTIDVSSLESFNVTGPFSQSRLYTIQQDIPANNPQLQIQLPVGPMYRGFLINTDDGGSDSSTLLQNFKVLSGTTVFADVAAVTMRQQYEIRADVQRPRSSTGYIEPKLGTANKMDGWYMYDHVTDGYNSEAIDTLGFSEFTLELNINKGSGTTTLFVVPIQLIPVRGGAKKA